VMMGRKEKHSTLVLGDDGLAPPVSQAALMRRLCCWWRACCAVGRPLFSRSEHGAARRGKKLVPAEGTNAHSEALNKRFSWTRTWCCRAS